MGEAGRVDRKEKGGGGGGGGGSGEGEGSGDFTNGHNGCLGGHTLPEQRQVTRLVCS